MRRQTISVPTTHGMRKVRASVWGNFAIHRTVAGEHDFYRSYYTVTHLRSGFAASTYALSLASGVRLARMLAKCGIDWNFTKVPKRVIGNKRGRDCVARWKQLEAHRERS